MQDWSKLQNQKIKVREELKGERGRQQQHKCHLEEGVTYTAQYKMRSEEVLHIIAFIIIPVYFSVCHV